MSILSLLTKSPAALLRAQKFGKTKEQKKVIDFFASGGVSGCLSNAMDLEDYLELVEKKVNAIDFKAKAMEKIGIDVAQISEIAPICLTNFHFDSECYSVIGRIDDDDETVYAVSNKYSVAWLFFSDTQMYVYTYIFDTISNNVWEFCREFFYTDITCFRTIHRLVERIQTSTKGCTGCLPKPIHSDYDVDTLCITVPGEDYAISIKDSEESFNSIYAARAFIREKKYRT